MAFQNSYSSALGVDANKETEILRQLKSNPQELAKLGLSANEDFTQLKNDPTKYNKVLSYVKSQAYQSPAYGALATGQGSTAFAASQLPQQFQQTPYEYKASLTPKLQEQYNVPNLQRQYQSLQEQSYSAPLNIRETVAKKGGYDIDALKSTQDQATTNFIEARNAYMRGEIDRTQYIDAIDKLSVSARSLAKGEKQLDTETEKALGTYQQMEQKAQNAFQNAYAQYQQALSDESAGYKEARTEKMSAAEEMYTFAKELFDSAKKQEKIENTTQKITQDQMSDFVNWAKTEGYQIDETTGEILNPDQKIINEYNKRFETNKWKMELPSNEVDNYKKTIADLVKGENGQTRTDIPEIETLLNEAAQKEGWTGEKTKAIFDYLYQTADELAKTRWNFGRFIGKN
jgi:hypothetical protein